MPCPPEPLNPVLGTMIVLQLGLQSVHALYSYMEWSAGGTCPTKLLLSSTESEKENHFFQSR